MPSTVPVASGFYYITLAERYDGCFPDGTFSRNVLSGLLLGFNEPAVCRRGHEPFMDSRDHIICPAGKDIASRWRGRTSDGTDNDRNRCNHRTGLDNGRPAPTASEEIPIKRTFFLIRYRAIYKSASVTIYLPWPYLSYSSLLKFWVHPVEHSLKLKSGIPPPMGDNLYSWPEQGLQ